MNRERPHSATPNKESVRSARVATRHAQSSVSRCAGGCADATSEIWLTTAKGYEGGEPLDVVSAMSALRT
jgi:hypothetical protein